MKTETTQVTKLTAILALKAKFSGNNPASWSKLPKKELSSMYAEYILEDKSKKVKIL